MKKITRFLWWCAGARPEILESCTLDHAKYFGIGGTILFTALMASFAGGYAFFTAFKQVSETFGADGVTKIETILPVSYYLAISFGIFWGLLIFNLDRYIVATIKDDGKASISKGEWQNAAPRLIMAILLGLVISTPLELKLFEKEINVEVKNIIRDERAKLGNDETPILKLIAKKENEKLQLKKDQIEAENKPNALPNTTNQPEDLKVQLLNDQISQVESDIKANQVMWDKLDKERKVAENDNDTEEEKRLRIKRNKYDNSANYPKKQKLLEDITTQKTDKINRQMQLITDATQLKKINQPQIEALNEEIKTLNTKLGSKRDENDETAKQYSGLMARLEALSRLTDKYTILFIVKWLITFLFIFIEVAPVLFKLMTESGPYDDITKRIRHEVNVSEQQKISNLNDEINTNILISTEKNKGRLDAELQGNKELLNAIALAQADIAKKAVDKWKEREITKLDKSLSHIIQSNQKEDINYTDKFWVKNDNGMESIYCFKNGTSNEIWLRENNKIKLGKWTSLNAKELEIEFENEKKLFHIDELTETNFKLSEVGTQNKLNLTIT